MKVLLLPTNIASDLSHKVKALRGIGIDARGLAFSSSTVQSADNIKLINSEPGKNEHLRIFRSIKYLYNSIKRADVLHWFGSFDSINFSSQKLNLNIRKIDKKILQRFDKPGVIQWNGSDIRNPEIDCRINRFYRRAFENGYEYADYESAENSLSNQKEFAAVGFYPLEFIGMQHYIDRELFPKRFPVWQSVDLSEHKPNFPSAENKKPLIVHSPTAPVAKGTSFILEAVEQLKSKYDFEFKLVQNIERKKALEIMGDCDIFVDQLILGAHGAAAVEAMAFGKPVICYINEEIGKNYTDDLPLINANPETIAEKLEMLLKNPHLRNEIGKKSRNYVEKYHDERKIAESLVETYQTVIELHKQKNV